MCRASNDERLIFKILCNPFTGTCIRLLMGNHVPDVRWSRFRFNLADTSIAPRFVASVFWGFYESAEGRLIERHLSDQYDVVELGASIGVISSHIAAKLGRGRKLIAVEPNPNFCRPYSATSTAILLPLQQPFSRTPHSQLHRRQ